MKIITRIAGFIVAVGVLCALASLLLWALIDIDQRIFRQRSERLLHDIVTLELRRTTLHGLEPLLNTWHDGVTRSPVCIDAYCDIRITVERPFTDALQALLVASVPRGLRIFEWLGGRPATAEARIYVRNGFAWGREYALNVYVYPSEGKSQWQDGYFVSGRVQTLPWAYHNVFDYQYVKGAGEYQIGLPEDCTQCKALWVDFTPYASDEDVRRLSRFNFDCLTHGTPCTTPAEVLPEAAGEVVRVMPQVPPAIGVCGPSNVSAMSRDASNAGVFVVENVRPESANALGYWDALDLRMMDRIKSGYEWEMGSIRRVVPVTAHKVMNPRPRTFYVGQKVIAFFGDALPNATSAKDASFPVGACGVVPYTNENLKLARAGAVLDERLTPLAAYELNYHPDTNANSKP